MISIIFRKDYFVSKIILLELSIVVTIVTEKSPHILIRNFGVENNIWSDEKSVNITCFIILENSEGE